MQKSPYSENSKRNHTEEPVRSRPSVQILAVGEPPFSGLGAAIDASQMNPPEREKTPNLSENDLRI